MDIKQKKLLPHSPQPSPKLFRGEKRRIHHQKACDAAAKRYLAQLEYHNQLVEPGTLLPTEEMEAPSPKSSTQN
ncbi:hypothetical protein AWENTII_003359 [Aspergillus wentii]